MGYTQEQTEALQLSGDLLSAAADLLKFLLPTEHDGELREFSGKIRDKYVKNVLILGDFVANFKKRRLSLFFYETVSHLLWIV